MGMVATDFLGWVALLDAVLTTKLARLSSVQTMLAALELAMPEYLKRFKDLTLAFSELKVMVPERLVLPFFFFMKEVLRFVSSHTNESGQVTILSICDLNK
eukprot:CAMPEP_0117035864 /NCGR_PEP_ID=MMETSP0472-20121206/25448_1 /TAXON_ID=693140 ORGANISM="Tiarina fusus, Strain LIS" /NCGR_SAMPLE_ID=MMETSP0472 /ASSEMBLY_ACC=CAM_ASM_000603 /LENGTH=100 /DNA_ID=CAMNT_0004745467 /DNA_START=207 /DNA_END=509 /DNA_ORIENTATION=+